jgi:hypothetical protein
MRRKNEPGGNEKGECGDTTRPSQFRAQGRTRQMNDEAGREELGFKVVCTWCGSLIRRTSVKDSHGMCLNCYSRMLGQHGHMHERRDDTLRWARGNKGER